MDLLHQSSPVDLLCVDSNVSTPVGTGSVLAYLLHQTCPVQLLRVKFLVSPPIVCVSLLVHVLHF